MKKLYSIVLSFLLIANQGGVPLVFAQEEFFNDDDRKISIGETLTSKESLLINEEKTPIMIQPMMEEVAGRVAISIPDYEPSEGWRAGDIKDVIITVNNTMGLHGTRFISIKIPEGMRFVNYPVPNPIIPELELQADIDFMTFINTVTEKPEQQDHYPSVNKGYLKYDINTTSGFIVISGLRLTVDENVYYGNTGLLTIGNTGREEHKIEVIHGIFNGMLTDRLVMDIQLAQTADPTELVSIVSDPGWSVMEMTSGDPTPQTSRSHTINREGSLYPQKLFFKKVDVDFYYPKELEFIGATTGDGISYVVDTTGGVVHFTLTNRFISSSYGDLNVLLSSENTPVGVYTASSRNIVKIEMFDDKIIEFGTGATPNPLQINVTETSTVTPPPSSGGGGGSNIKQQDSCPNGDYSPSYYDGECGTSPIQEEEHGSGEEESTEENNQEEGDDKDPEIVEEKTEEELLYEWAKEYKLTDATSLEEMRLADKITRAEMAKLISRYSENVRNVIPDQTKESCNSFNDLETAPEHLQESIVKSCQLGLMGYYSDGETKKEYFTPNEIISRAEVATIISRMLRGNTNKGSEERWYQNHLLALRKREIIQRDIDPMTKELRGNVFLMLYRVKETT